MIKIDIVTGFLGAGKTTLLNKLLSEAYIGEKIALLENEFGEIALDGTFLGGHDIRVKELSSGCICCSLQGDFITGLTELASDYAPERILIEPTGFAMLSDVIAACQKAAKAVPMEVNAAMTVVDATMLQVFLKLGGSLFLRQIADGMFIVLSHIQNLKKEITPESVVEQVRGLNAHAPILCESWDKVNGLAILHAAEQAKRVSEPEHDGHIHHSHHHVPEGYSSCSVVVPQTIDAGRLNALSEALSGSAGGEVIRAKGLLNTENGPVRFDCVGGRYTLIPCGFKGDGKLVVIGRLLDNEYWNGLLK